MSAARYELADPRHRFDLLDTSPADIAVLRALHADAPLYTDEPFVVRWSSHLGELEDRRQFCVGCGRLLDAWTEDGRRWCRLAPVDGEEQRRAVAGLRTWVESVRSAYRATPTAPAQP